MPVSHHLGPAHAAGPRRALRPARPLKALAEAEFHHDTRPADIQATLRRGHPGSANLRAALKHHTPGHGKVNMWPTRRVAVELDGREPTRPHQADSDDDRDLWLRRHRYITRRYGERQLDEQPDNVIIDLQDAFAQAAAYPSSS
jgi:hypothetical protein